VRQVFTPVVWKIKVPPRIHVFLCLVANNKFLTRDNLAKRKSLDDLSCLFYCENETASHLFFDCCVAKYMWMIVSEFLGIVVGDNLEFVAKLWVMGSKFKLINVCTTAVLWSIWKIRNDICFQVDQWMGMKKVLGRCGATLKNWSMLTREDAGQLLNWAEELELRSMQPPQITWEAPQGGQNLVHEPDDGVLRSLSFNAMVPVGSGPLVGEDAADLRVMSVMAPGAINAELGF
jgi:hypothetical protein